MTKILHIVPYKKLYPPQNGGALRCYYLYKSLATQNDVDLVTLQDSKEFNWKDKSELPANVNIYGPSDFKKSFNLLNLLPKRIADPLMYRYLIGSLKGPADATLLELYPMLQALLQKNKYDAVVFEHLQSMMAARYIRKRNPAAKLILDAHNVDHILVEKESKFKNEDIEYLKTIARIKEIESSLINYIDGFLACSAHDEFILKKLNRGNLQSIIIPNGVDIENKPFYKNKKSSASILFCGDLTTAANKDGILWFYSDIFPLVIKQVPEVHLTIVGSGAEDADFIEMKKNERITFAGRVDSVVPFYHSSFVAIAPLRIGSGTRLKILEAMSLGNPVVSTGVGAEGVNYPQESIKISDDITGFSDNIVKLFRNSELAEEQRVIARAFVEKEFSWSAIGNTLNTYLKKIIHNEP